MPGNRIVFVFMGKVWFGVTGSCVIAPLRTRGVIAVQDVPPSLVEESSPEQFIHPFVAAGKLRPHRLKSPLLLWVAAVVLPPGDSFTSVGSDP
jgi:hypothetical protein